MIHSTTTAPSHSRLACFHACDRKYYYDYILRLRSKDEFPPAYAGSCGHVGLDVWHRTGDAEAAMAAMTAAWGSKRFHGDWDYLTPGHLETVLHNYTESKHAAGWEVVKLRRSDLVEDRLLATDVVEDAGGYLVLAEATFVVDVPNMGTVNIRPDLLLRTGSGLQIVDHKFSTSYLGSKMYNGAKFRHQLRLYAIAMAALLGEPVVSGMVNGIFLGDKASSPKFGGNRFDAMPFDYSEADFEETRHWYAAGVTKMQVLEKFAAGAKEEDFPQNPDDRCGYCDYGTLCIAPAALRPGLVKMQYRRKEG